MKLLLFIGGIFFISFLQNCKKENAQPINPVPTISIKSVSSYQVKQFKDSLGITLSYSDEDGDLGHINADILSLEVKDSRLSAPDYYYVAPLAPIESTVSIKGELQVKLKNLFLLGSGTQEITQLTFRIKDRVGNWSNSVKTKDIVINQ